MFANFGYFREQMCTVACPYARLQSVLLDPRSLVPESIMPSYPWLATTPVDASTIRRKMEVLRRLGHPYSDEQIAAAPDALVDKTELDALVAYLQSLGTAIRSKR